MAKYQFDYDDSGVYGRVVGLLEKTATRGGVVIDLGCGYGAVAQPITERGFEYVGFDLDGDGIRDLRDRGHDAHVLDLTDPRLEETIRTALRGRSISAILLLDIVEHLAEPKEFVQRIRRLAGAEIDGVVIVSIPNVAHLDLAAKLLTGRWDVTPTGLLDETHLHLFTNESLTSFMTELGLHEIHRDDYELRQSDQHFPSLHPALAAGSSLRSFTQWVRGQADEFLFVNQFCRAYRPGETVQQAPIKAVGGEPFLSVLLRTQGRRPVNLIDALTCLGGQTCQDFECLLLVHDADEEGIALVRGIADDFDGAVGSQLHLLEVDGGLRGRPLNVGSNNALGRYIAFLDDDDQITSGWVEAFRRGAEAAPGRVVRTRGWARNIDRDDAPEGMGFRLSGWPHLRYNRPFDFIEHLMNNSTPICNFAVPRDAVRTLGLTFDESLPVHEDWDFFLRAANLLGVLDDDEATSIYHHWGEGDSSRLLGPEEWNRTKKYVSDLWAQRPVLLAPHDVARLNEYLSTMRALERKVETAETRVKRAEERVGASDKAARKANLELNRILNSRSWKVGAPLRGLRRLRDLGRGFVSGQRGKRVRRSRT